MIRKTTNGDISDEEFNAILKPFLDNYDEYIESYVMERYKKFWTCKKNIISKHNTIAECRYYISSLYNDIETFSNAIRLHWSVENKLHWHLDFTFKQDENSTMDKNALFNLQILKKLSLAFLNDVKRVYNTSLKNIRFKLSLNYETEILRFFNILAH